jgi:superfamily I DNA and/or RNA helicase
MSIETADFGVVAPYRNQVKECRRVLRARGLGSVRVGTVDDYQGQEAKIMVISTTVTGTGKRQRAQA